MADALLPWLRWPDRPALGRLGFPDRLGDGTLPVTFEPEPVRRWPRGSLLLFRLIRHPYIPSIGIGPMIAVDGIRTRNGWAPN